MKSFAWNLAATFVIVALSLLAYDRFVMRPAQQIGIVDLGEVYRAKEAEFGQMLAKSGSEEERQRALVMAQQFAQRLPLALEELPRDCGCLVVLKSAVAGSTPNSVDLTSLLKKKVDAS